MLKLREIIRLKNSALSQQQIARSLNISVGAVHKYLHLAQEKGLTWTQVEGMTEKALREHLLPPREFCPSFVSPDYEWVYKEMKHKSVTLQLLHEEYCQLTPGKHYSYRSFCNHYQAWKKGRRLSLRQEHKGGDKLFTDYVGPTYPFH
jgi:transposase